MDEFDLAYELHCEEIAMYADDSVAERFCDDNFDHFYDEYSDLAPVPGEEKYCEWDHEFGYWGVFGAESGFCYGQYEEEQFDV